MATIPNEKLSRYTLATNYPQDVMTLPSERFVRLVLSLNSAWLHRLQQDATAWTPKTFGELLRQAKHAQNPQDWQS